MKKAPYIVACASAILLTITYFVLVDEGWDKDAKSLTDTGLVQHIKGREDAPYDPGRERELRRLRREQRMRRYIPAWVDGRPR